MNIKHMHHIMGLKHRCNDNLKKRVKRFHGRKQPDRSKQHNRMLFVTSYWCCYFHFFLQPKRCYHVMNNSLLWLVDVCEYLKTTKLM